MRPRLTRRVLLIGIAVVGAMASYVGLSVAQSGAEPASAGTISYEEIVAKYADPDSRFVVLEGNDGINVHYKDRGSGPAVLLVHSSTGDLKDYDGWVDILGEDYRVVRFDLPAFGLTGPVPSGNYSIDRFLALVDSLMDHLGIERFAIAGASYGGLVAFRYAGTRTDRVTGLVLLNSAGIEYGGRGGTTERDRDTSAVFVPKRYTTGEMGANLRYSVNDHGNITEELIQRKTDYWNVIGRDREGFIAMRMYERGNPERVLARVRAPALVMWGGASRALSPETAQAFVDAMKNAASREKIIFDGGGHFLHISRPEATGRAVKAFLDREIRSSATHQEEKHE
ncbi:MAG: alpha/beta hydrolase [Gammaproteobacteria bacterium]|nr:alpha/beta hydrolase [Gammaproteobacteria bacterium]